MDNQFPRMLYKAGGSEPIHGGHFASLIVADQAEQDGALDEGWALTTPEALELDVAAKQAAAEAMAKANEAAAAAVLADDTKPPTREELEQMATKLGLPFSARVSDKKLAALIKAASEQTEV